MRAVIVSIAALVIGTAGCSKDSAPTGSSPSATPPTAPAGTAATAAGAAPTEKDFCGLTFPPGAEVKEAKSEGGDLTVRLVSPNGFNKVESFFSNQLFGSTDQTMSNKDELRSKTWDKPSPDGKCKLRVDIKGDPTPNQVHISIVRKAG